MQFDEFVNAAHLRLCSNVADEPSKLFMQNDENRPHSGGLVNQKQKSSQIASCLKSVLKAAVANAFASS